MKMHVRSSRAPLIVGLVIGIAFLVFGVVFLVVLANEGSQIGVAFMGFWIFLVGVIIAFNAYHLVVRKAAVMEIETEAEVPAGSEPDFEAKLRRLERLKSDRLISEEEYRRKRAEILDQKW